MDNLSMHDTNYENTALTDVFSRNANTEHSRGVTFTGDNHYKLGQSCYTYRYKYQLEINE